MRTAYTPEAKPVILTVYRNIWWCEWCWSVASKYLKMMQANYVAMLLAVANVVKLFRCNYVTISPTSIKIIGKYAAIGINYAPKL
jgi:hypothetical protein